MSEAGGRPSNSGDTHPLNRPVHTGRDKRSRSWDVDVSLDELVEWDALEQFMSDMPGAEGAARPSSGRALSGADIPLSAIGARPGSLGPMGCVGVPRSVSTDSAVVALGLGGQAGLVPGAWPLMANLSAAGGGGSTSLGGATGGVLGGATGALSSALSASLSGLPSAATGNAATLAQSLYSSWQTPGTSSQLQLQLQGLPMERGVSWGAELLPLMGGVDAAAGLVDASALGGAESPTSSETQQGANVAGAATSAAGAGGDEGGSAGGRQKQRFVWTSELHRRFEAAVNTLGVDQAKPQVRERARALARCGGVP
jgi:hypothetical protein